MTLKLVSIDFAELTGGTSAEWLEQVGRKADELPTLECEVEVDININDFDDDDLIDEYDRRFGDDDAVANAYRLMSEGDHDGAMHELAHAFPYLRHPDAEKRLASLIARGRAKEAQGALL